jgi:hypothetical protein
MLDPDPYPDPHSINADLQPCPQDRGAGGTDGLHPPGFSLQSEFFFVVQFNPSSFVVPLKLSLSIFVFSCSVAEPEPEP